MRQTMIVDVVADVVCPWCFLGWRRLKATLALRPDVDSKLIWRPYQLDPTLPEDGVDRKAYMAAKFKDPARLKAVHQALLEGGSEDGITFNFEIIEKSPNTNAAHRLIRWALTAGVQDQVVEALFGRARYWRSPGPCGYRRSGGHGAAGRPAIAIGGGR